MAERTVTLTMDEIAELVTLLGIDHDPRDFEPECPLCTAYRKLLAAEAGPAPGFKLVPISPTAAMVDAGLAEHDTSAAPEDEMAGAYRAMVAAAPGVPGKDGGVQG